MSTTKSERKDIVRRINSEVWGDGNLELLDEFIADDYVEHNTASPDEIRGPEGYKENVELFHSAFSDVEVTTNDVMADSEKVVHTGM